MRFSIERRVAAVLITGMYRGLLHHRLPLNAQRLLLDATGRALQPVPTKTTVERITLGGRPAERIAAPNSSSTAVILHLHGGGYTTGSLTTHRSFGGYLARSAGATVYMLDYRLAPEHPFPAGLDDAVAAYLELAQLPGIEPNQITLGGDSAGGGLAVAAARRLIDTHGITPAALALVSPWVDPNFVSPRKRDAVVNTAWSRACALAYLGDGDPNDPGYAPALGNLAGLPPTLVQTCNKEMLYDQNVEFVERLRSAGVDAERSDFPDLWHDAPLQAAFVREASTAVDELGDFVRSVSEAAVVEPPERNVD